ncbi:hypothetical protein AVEN_247929-1 [Araneus ventricosus]|uniref:Uncharacterized protein n=1 Tax=Araneus ventricosus TaxID=182803 RepID=A0A4Y2CJE7_ARAVE|nr:hypothetical protein AVEN_247929-1 [Araneus ventricosus]
MWARPAAGVVRKFGVGVPAQVSSSSSGHGSKLEVRPKVALLLLQNDRSEELRQKTISLYSLPKEVAKESNKVKEEAEDRSSIGFPPARMRGYKVMLLHLFHYGFKLKENCRFATPVELLEGFKQIFTTEEKGIFRETKNFENN